MAEPTTPSLSSWYDLHLEPYELNTFRFRFALLRREVLPFPLDAFLETVEWGEEEEGMASTLTLRRPKGRSSLPVERGNTVRCDVLFRGTWYELWRMSCKPPSVSDYLEGQVSVEAVDELGRLGSHTHTYRWRRRSPAYHAHEIAMDVARREGISLGSIAKGTAHFTELEVKGTPLDAIKAAYAKEKEQTGRSFVIRMNLGRLDILPLTQRNPTLYGLRRAIEAASVTEEIPESAVSDESTEGGNTGEARAASPVTVIYATGTVGKGKSARKVRHTVFDQKTVERFGYRRQDKDYKQVESHADLVNRAKRDLAAGLRLKRTYELTHPGIPFIRRGEGIRAQLVQEEEAVAESYVYIAAHRHTLTARDYTMNVGLVNEDPFVAAEKDRIGEAEKLREKPKEPKK